MLSWPPKPCDQRRGHPFPAQPPACTLAPLNGISWGLTMRICIHRGTREIGGTCVEVESQGKRIVLDVGMPLDMPRPDQMQIHPVPGFEAPDPSLLGVIISHPHQDHYGLASRLPTETTFLIGEAARRILEESEFWTPVGLTIKHAIYLEHNKPIQLEPFRITPYLVDHSAHGSYAVLVEADGKRLFYSGDIRAHGRKAELVECLIANPPKYVDVLLLEGTTLGRPGSDEGFPSEDDLVPEFVEQFNNTDGLVLVWASGQNIDRIVTLYKACRQAKRNLILDPYTLSILRATGNKRIPQAGWANIRVFAPHSQRLRMLQSREFERINPLNPFRVYPKALPAQAARSVLLFRPGMIGDLDRIRGLKIGWLILSVWRGYVENGRNQALLDWLHRRCIPLSYCHTSGHADVNDLLRLRGAWPEAVVVPIHTERSDLYARLFGELKLLDDGQWWTLT